LPERKPTARIERRDSVIARNWLLTGSGCHVQRHHNCEYVRARSELVPLAEQRASEQMHVAAFDKETAKPLDENFCQ